MGVGSDALLSQNLSQKWLLDEPSQVSGNQIGMPIRLDTGRPDHVGHWWPKPTRAH